MDVTFQEFREFYDEWHGQGVKAPVPLIARCNRLPTLNTVAADDDLIKARKELAAVRIDLADTKDELHKASTFAHKFIFAAGETVAAMQQEIDALKADLADGQAKLVALTEQAQSETEESEWTPPAGIGAMDRPRSRKEWRW